MQSSARFYAAPLIGEIGVDVTPRMVGQLVAQARNVRADYLLLIIQGPGGRVDAKEQIQNVIQSAVAVRIVAYVPSDCYSADALIALSCPVIFVGRDAQIGAAAMINGDPSRLGYSPMDANAETAFLKEQSATYAKERQFTERAGHSPLFATAMQEAGYEIWFGPDNSGRITLSSTHQNANWEMLKAKGSLLTLNATMAQKTGLSSGVTDSFSKIPALLGYAKSEVISEPGFKYMKEQAGVVHARLSRVEAINKRLPTAKTQALDAVNMRDAAMAETDRLQNLKPLFQNTYDLSVAQENTAYSAAIIGLNPYQSAQDARTYTDLTATHQRTLQSLANDWQSLANKLVANQNAAQAEAKKWDATAIALINEFKNLADELKSLTSEQEKELGGG